MHAAPQKINPFSAVQQKISAGNSKPWEIRPLDSR
jgi:hypothetical protein